MKKYFLTAALAAVVFLGSQELFAQSQTTDSLRNSMDLKTKSGEDEIRADRREADDRLLRESDNKRLGDFDEIIIKRKGTAKNSKVIIEIRDDKVMVDGKPIDQYENDQLSVVKRLPKRMLIQTEMYGQRRPEGAWNFEGGEERSFLGVATETADGGAKIVQVSENSAAEKAGLKIGDIITKINNTTINSSGHLAETVGHLKAMEKITVTYKRSGTEKTAPAILGKRRESAFTIPNESAPPRPPMEFNFSPDDLIPDQAFNNAFKPRIGIKAQDTENDKGVKVLEVDSNSPADKAGIKEDDLITSFDGIEVSSADQLAKLSRDAKDKSSMKVQLKRGGKSQIIEIKIPKKLKTANL